MKRLSVVVVLLTTAACHGKDLTSAKALELAKKSPTYNEPLTITVSQEYVVPIERKQTPQQALDDFLKGKNGQTLTALAALKYVMWEPQKSQRVPTDAPFDIFGQHEKQDVWVLRLSLLDAGARVASTPKPRFVPGTSSGVWAFPVATQQPSAVTAITPHHADQDAAVFEIETTYTPTPLGRALIERGVQTIPSHPTQRPAEARRFADGWRLAE